jgi:peptidoglycan/LPS O-acetylase OafA/YrhL
LTRLPPPRPTLDWLLRSGEPLIPPSRFRIGGTSTPVIPSCFAPPRDPTSAGGGVGEAAGSAGRAEIRSLTGLRGVAASVVMLYHFVAPRLGSDVGSTFLRKGYLWVDLFFVLSGFVMALNYAAPFACRGTARWRAYINFLIRRLARIYPLYFLITLESAATFVLRHQSHPGFTGILTANIAMVQAWGIAPSLEGATWSVSTEWAAYLMFPALAAAALASRRSTAAMLALAALAGIVAISLAHGVRLPGQDRSGPLDIYSEATPAPVLRCVAEFVLGLLAYRWFLFAGAARHLWTVLLLCTILGAMALPETDVLVVALFPPLVATLALSNGPLPRLLGSPPFLLLGNISYSVYLLHGKFLRVETWTDRALAPLGLWAVPISTIFTMLLVYGFAMLVHRAVELPSRAVMRRLVTRPATVTAQPVALRKPPSS